MQIEYKSRRGREARRLPAKQSYAGSTPVDVSSSMPRKDLAVLGAQRHRGAKQSERGSLADHLPWEQVQVCSIHTVQTNLTESKSVVDTPARNREVEGSIPSSPTKQWSSSSMVEPRTDNAETQVRFLTRPPINGVMQPSNRGRVLHMTRLAPPDSQLTPVLPGRASRL